MPWVDEYRDPAAKMRRYFKKARPASFSSKATHTPKRRAGYLSLSQSASFATPLIAGSLTDIQARAWSTQTGKTARLSDFVSASELPRFTSRVRTSIRKAECYDGFEIDLPASYMSFPHWVPLQRGIAVWFPEYEFGRTIMSLKVSWP